jgi:hypothetical protein
MAIPTEAVSVHPGETWSTALKETITANLQILTCRYQISRKYRVDQKSVNLKYSLVLTGMFRFKTASQFVERFHSPVGCALNMESLTSKQNFNSINNKVNLRYSLLYS